MESKTCPPVGYETHAEFEAVMLYCGDVCMAARQLGIYGKLHVIKEGEYDAYYFEWFDPMAGVRWSCQTMSEKTYALDEACKSLVEYLNPDRFKQYAKT